MSNPCSVSFSFYTVNYFFPVKGGNFSFFFKRSKKQQIMRKICLEKRENFQIPFEIIILINGEKKPCYVFFPSDCLLMFAKKKFEKKDQ